jgi:hypothetical protein
MEVKKDMINATRGGMNMNVSTPETGKLNCKKSIILNSVYYMNWLNYFIFIWVTAVYIKFIPLSLASWVVRKHSDCFFYLDDGRPAFEQQLF